MAFGLPKGRAKRAALVAGFAAASLALAACSSSDDDTPTAEPTGADMAAPADFGELNLQLSWIKNEEFSGEFFADSKGYYTDQGFSTVNLIPGPSTGVAELASGAADVALSDAISIGAAVGNEGAPLKIIATTYQKNPFTVLSLKDGGNIQTPQDLIGKKIGVQDSNTSLFLALLAANNISPDQLTIVPVQYDPAPLTNGEVDGFIAYLTNEAITVAASGVETTNLPFADNGLPFVAETFTVTDDTLTNKRDEIKAFLMAEIMGWKDAVADPAEGARLAYEQYGADLGLDPANSEAGAIAQAEELVTSDETAANGLFTISDSLKDQTITSLAGAGITVTKEQLFDTSIIDEIYAEHPELKSY
jgi:ABC-type nitrate/sulfonate/bicarbonate transport system substrate-binding protein